MITPLEDSALVKLLQYLKEYLNGKATDFFVAQGLDVQQAVAHLEVGQTDTSGVRQFPLLSAARVEFRGDQFERTSAIIDYFLLVSLPTYRTQQAYFTWVARHIAEALKEYNDIDGTCMCEVRALRGGIVFSTTESRGKKIKIPRLRIQFEFTDLEPLA